MGGGYVLAFSNRTFSEFIMDSTGRDIYDAPSPSSSSGRCARSAGSPWRATNPCTASSVSMWNAWRQTGTLTQRWLFLDGRSY